MSLTEFLLTILRRDVMKTSILFFAFCLIFVLISCSEDDNGTEPTTIDYYWYAPTKIGNYRIDDTYKIDENGNRLELLRSDDSLVFSHNQMVGDKNCFVWTKFDMQGNIYMALPTYLDGSKFYVYPAIWDAYVKFFKANLKIDF